MRTIYSIRKLTNLYKKSFEDIFFSKNKTLIENMEEDIIKEARDGSNHLRVNRRLLDKHDSGLNIYDLQEYYQKQGYRADVTGDYFHLYW